MSLRYKNHKIVPLIGTKTSDGTRTSVTLTDSYDVANKTKIFETGGYSKLDLNILYTMGAEETANTFLVRLEGSYDGINFYRIPNDSTSGATSTITAREFSYTGTDPISISIDIFYKRMRISVKEGGVESNAGTAFVEGVLSGS